MLPAPIEHRFTIDDAHYCLVEWDRGGERRIKADYALAISPAPSVMDSMDGANLYAEAVARECLKEAPALFWAPLPPETPVNGTVRRVVTLEHIPRALWEAFRKEVDVFVGKIFSPAAPESAPALAAGPEHALAVAAVETVSPVLRGRAE